MAYGRWNEDEHLKLVNGCVLGVHILEPTIMHCVGTGLEGINDGHIGDLAVEAAELVSHSLQPVKVVFDAFGGALRI